MPPRRTGNSTVVVPHQLDSTSFRPTTALEARLAANLPEHASAGQRRKRGREQKEATTLTTTTMGSGGGGGGPPPPTPRFQSMTGKGRTRREELEAAVAETNALAAAAADDDIDDDEEEEEELEDVVLEDELLVEEDGEDSDDELAAAKSKQRAKDSKVKTTTTTKSRSAAAPTATTTTTTTREKNLNKRNSGSVGRRKITMSFIEEKARRTVTFTKRKSGLMKKAYELSTLTGTDCLVVVVSESGLVYTFATPSLKGVTESERGKSVIADALKGDLTPGEGPDETVYDRAGKGKARDRSGSATATPTATTTIGLVGGGGGNVPVDDLYLGMIDPSLSGASGSSYPPASSAPPPPPPTTYPFSISSPHSLPIPPPSLPCTSQPSSASSTLPALVMGDHRSHHHLEPHHLHQQHEEHYHLAHQHQQHRLPHPHHHAFSYLDPVATAAVTTTSTTVRSPFPGSSSTTFQLLEPSAIFHFDPPPPPPPPPPPALPLPQPPRPLATTRNSVPESSSSTTMLTAAPDHLHDRLDPAPPEQHDDNDDGDEEEEEEEEEDGEEGREDDLLREARGGGRRRRRRPRPVAAADQALEDKDKDVLNDNRLSRSSEGRNEGRMHRGGGGRGNGGTPGSNEYLDEENEHRVDQADGDRDQVGDGDDETPSFARATRMHYEAFERYERVANAKGFGGFGRSAFSSRKGVPGGSESGNKVVPPSSSSSSSGGLGGGVGREGKRSRRESSGVAAVGEGLGQSDSAEPDANDDAREEGAGGGGARDGNGTRRTRRKLGMGDFGDAAIEWQRRVTDRAAAIASASARPASESERGAGRAPSRGDRDDVEARRKFWRDRARESIANAKASRTITRCLHAHFLSVLASRSTVVPPSIPVVCPETHQVVGAIENLPMPSPSAVTYGLLKQFVRDEHLDDFTTDEGRMVDFEGVIDWFLLEQEEKADTKLVGTMKQHLIEWFDFLEGHELVSEDEHARLVAFGHSPYGRVGEKARDAVRAVRGVSL